MKRRDFNRLIKAAVGAPPVPIGPKSTTPFANTVAKWMAPAAPAVPAVAAPKPPLTLPQAKQNLTAATAANQPATRPSWVPYGIPTNTEEMQQFGDAYGQTLSHVGGEGAPNNFYREWLGPKAGWLPDAAADAGRQFLNTAREGIGRMGNAGSAVASGNLSGAAYEATQGALRGAQTAAAVAPGLASVPVMLGSALLQDDKGMNVPAATGAVAQATGKPPEAVAEAAQAAGFSGADFEKMMPFLMAALPFLMAALPMLFGGDAPGSGFSNPNYVPSGAPSVIDRMGAMSRFG